MFWRSVVGKVWFTILLLVSFVLFILTVLLIEFFENFHITEAEKDLEQTAVKVSVMVEQYNDRALIRETTERVKDPSSKVAILFDEGVLWVSESDDESLPDITNSWLVNNQEFTHATDEEIRAQTKIVESQEEVLMVAVPLQNADGAVYVYQSLGVLRETTAQTTQIIFLGAGVAFILTTIFAFFLSTRITSPLIKMREGAAELARGEFNTKIPILTNDEIGDLALAFNRMGRQLKFHINALRQEKEQVSSILSSMADGVITLNRKGEVIVSNPPAERFLGDWRYDRQEKDGNYEDSSDLPEELNEILAEVISTEKEVMRELQIQGRNWVMIMTPLYDQTYVRGTVAVFRDMTEERRMDKLREDFIANVSHELRTPISLLQGYSEAIVDDIAETKEEKNELAQIIHDESMRIGRLVNELLDLARMESGHIQLNQQLIHVIPFAERIIRKFSGMAKDKNIELKVVNMVTDDLVLLDADRIEQVFTNLIDNAITHSYMDSTIVIKLETTSDRFSAYIQDRGAGIPNEDLPFVFERFYKADKSRKREKGKQGTGLGLAIAKNIIEAHQGTITVQSKKGEGTTFSFHIPRKP